MLRALDARAVRIGADPHDKAAAIRQVGELLIAARKIDPAYFAGMLAREKIASTFLGNGIAIPHGIREDRELVREKGVAVLQVPGGVEWNVSETVRLVVGIAAESDGHLAIPARLIDVLSEPDEAALLATTTDAGRIAARLSGSTPGAISEASVASANAPAAVANEGPGDGPHVGPRDGMDDGFDFTIANPHGLHARPATAFVELAKGFQARARVRHEDEIADGKSPISLLQLGARKGVTVRVAATGPDAAPALAALKAAMEKGLEDEAQAAADAAPAMVDTRQTVRWEGRTAAGIPASPDVAQARRALVDRLGLRRDRTEAADARRDRSARPPGGNPADTGLISRRRSRKPMW